MRIIAGVARGIPLYCPPGVSIRPTGDRVRESLFNILAFRVQHAAFLDLFCGTGAVGIEALSRGASRCTFVDSSLTALRIVGTNLERSRLSKSAICMKMFLMKELRPVHAPYDLIFADPPYEWAEHAALLGVLDKQDFLAPDGTIILEIRRGIPLPEEVGRLKIIRRRRYGDTELVFFS